VNEVLNYAITNVDNCVPSYSGLNCKFSVTSPYRGGAIQIVYIVLCYYVVSY
jgi:hypothetical protein